MYNWRNIFIEDLLRIKDSHSTSSSALLTLCSSSKSSAMSRWRRKDDSSWSHLKWPETGLCCYFPSALFDLIGFNFIISILKDVNMHSGQRHPGGNDCLTSVHSSVQLTKPASDLVVLTQSPLHHEGLIQKQQTLCQPFKLSSHTKTHSGTLNSLHTLLPPQMAGRWLTKCRLA